MEINLQIFVRNIKYKLELKRLQKKMKPNKNKAQENEKFF